MFYSWEFQSRKSNFWEKWRKQERFIQRHRDAVWLCWVFTVDGWAELLFNKLRHDDDKYMTLVDLVPSFLPLRGSCPTEVLQGETQNLNLQLLHFLPLWGRHRGVCVSSTRRKYFKINLENWQQSWHPLGSPSRGTNEELISMNVYISFSLLSEIFEISCFRH